MRLLGISIIFVYLFIQAAHATHQVGVNAPPTMVTTVGQLATLQIDINNKGPTIEFYRVTITASSSQVEITNPTITTRELKPGETVSVFSNIRTLTESPAVLTIQIFRDNDLSHFLAPAPTISVSSKKFSLPEFGVIGFIQIITMAGVIYFLFYNRLKATQ